MKYGFQDNGISHTLAFPTVCNGQHWNYDLKLCTILMLCCVLHQPVLVDLHLSISFDPCNSGNALLQHEAENTEFSLFFPLVQRYLHSTSWTAGVKENRNRLWGQWRICDVGHKTQEDAVVVQGCRTEESSPTPPRATAPTRPGVSVYVLVFQTDSPSWHVRKDKQCS